MGDDIESYELQTGNANKKLRLLKIPQFVMNELRESKDGQTVGSVKRTVDEHGNETIRIIISSEGDAPKEFSVHKEPIPAAMQLLTKSGPTATVLGTVESMLQLTPDDPERYKKLIRERSEDASRRSLAAQVLDDRRSVYARSRKPVEMKRPGSERRFRKEREEIQDLLFRAFQEHTHLSMQEMCAIVDTPEMYLRPVVNELCERTTVPEKKKTVFKLREEWQQNKPANAAAQSSA